MIKEESNKEYFQTISIDIPEEYKIEKSINP